MENVAVHLEETRKDKMELDGEEHRCCTSKIRGASSGAEAGVASNDEGSSKCRGSAKGKATELLGGGWMKIVLPSARNPNGVTCVFCNLLLHPPHAPRDQ